MADGFDPLAPADQEVLRNKLSYLADFLTERDQDALSRNEQDHIAQLFRQKH